MPAETTTDDDWAGRRADGRRNRLKIIEAAHAVFAESGLSATIPQIAERAGVGKGSVYRSFATKDDLVAAIAARQIATLEQRIEAVGADAPPADAVVAMTQFVTILFETLANDRVLADTLAEGSPTSGISRLLDPLWALVDAAKDAGAVRRDATELDLRVMVCGAVLQLRRLEIDEVAAWTRYGQMALTALRPQ